MAVRGGSYTEPGQLQDVLALIQVLGFEMEPRRTTVQILSALRTPPSSGLKTWGEVAELHPEFFRVWGQNHDQIALAARFAADEGADERRFPVDFIQHMMRTAIEIHDRESKRRDRWTSVYVPLVISIVGAVGSFATALVAIWSAKH